MCEYYATIYTVFRCMFPLRKKIEDSDNYVAMLGLSALEFEEARRRFESTASSEYGFEPMLDGWIQFPPLVSPDVD
ncbi:hypothetical protein Tco_1364465, partial [Tanacetum coccineum]